MKSSASGYQSVWTTTVLGQTPARSTAGDIAAWAVPGESLPGESALVEDVLELQAAVRVAIATLLLVRCWSAHAAEEPAMRAAFSFGCATGVAP